MCDETRPMQRAGVVKSEILGEDQPRRRPFGHEARGESEREAHRRRSVAGRRRHDLVQAVARQTAPQRAIERAGQRKPRGARACPGPERASISSTARRKRAIPSALPPRDIPRQS